MFKLYMLFFAMRVAVCDCHTEYKHGFSKKKNHYSITKIGTLPETINESSGIVAANELQMFYTHNDGGGKAEIFKINQTGQIVDRIAIPHAQNIDWEDITKDDVGNIYIGDFGNNAHNRQNLCIYKFSPQGITQKISFRYADQKEFPSKYKNFDCEAFFWFEHKLYLFSKNWEQQPKTCKMYVLEDKAGSYEISPKESIKLKTAVTSAAISPDRKTFALLTYGKILLFDIINHQINFQSPKTCINFGKNQTEAIEFINNTDLLCTNEQRKIYLIRKK